jgi:5-(carboxyamino)imidazole ribonucleotide synthase
MLALAASRMGYRVVDDGDAEVVITEPDGVSGPEAGLVVIAARTEDGRFAAYAPIALDYTEGVLDVARTPAPVDAVALAQAKLDELNVIGVACVEFALTPDHSLAIGGVTPFPCAVGYLTSEAFVTDQFEQHIRAVCGLPLGSTDLLRPVAMAVLPEITPEAQPDWAAALAFSGVKLHLHEGHGYLTATAASATLAKQVVRAARAAALLK